MVRSAFCIATVLLLIGMLSILGVSRDKVVFRSGDNGLIALGCSKSFAGMSVASGQFALASAAGGETHVGMSAWRDRDYGDSFVRAEFETDAWSGIDYGEEWTELDGISETAWYGTWPQYYSTRIRIDESWRFAGYHITVSYPLGVGFTSQSATVSWSGDCAGDYWGLTHYYAGICAQSFEGLTSVRQNTLGSHFFATGESVGHSDWVSANASRGVSI